MSDDTRPDTIVLVHGFWVTPPELGGVGRPLPREGLHRLGAGVPRLRGRSRGAQRRSDADRASHDPGDRRRPRVDHRRARPAADPHGALRRRCDRPDPPRPRLRRRRCGASTRRRPRASRWRRCHSSSSTFPVLKNPANRHRAVGLRRSSSGATRSPTPSPRTRPARLYERYHVPGVRQHPLGQRPGQPPSPATRTIVGGLPATTPGRRCSSSPAPRTTSCRRSVQQSNAKHYKSNTVTEVKVFDGFSHLAPGA